MSGGIMSGRNIFLASKAIALQDVWFPVGGPGDPGPTPEPSRSSSDVQI